MSRVALLFLFIAGSLSAQMGFNRLSPVLVTYLELTSSQQDQIVQANASLNNFNAQKNRRSAQVQSEIQAELRKPDPDPMALGVRYRELEAIRRETAAEQDRTLQTVQAALTAAQKQKLATLQEALRLQSTACDAVNWNLMTPPLLDPIAIVAPMTGSVASFLLGSVSTPCGLGGVRTGDFSAMPPGRMLPPGEVRAGGE